MPMSGGHRIGGGSTTPTPECNESLPARATDEFPDGYLLFTSLMIARIVVEQHNKKVVSVDFIDHVHALGGRIDNKKGRELVCTRHPARS